MIRLNKLTDYAVVVMSELARCDSVVTAAGLARATGLPQPTVAKVLKLLTHYGLTHAARGANGGYGLSRVASAITVTEIVEAVEGPVAVAACVEDAPDGCARELSCSMCGGWDTVNRAIRAALDAVSLADMARTQARHARPPLFTLATDGR